MCEAKYDLCLCLCIVVVCMCLCMCIYILCAVFVTNTVMSFYVNVSGLPQE